MKLHQLNVSLDARQDRLLLRISTTAGEEFRFWLTRRLIQHCWPEWVSAMQQAEGFAATQVPLEFRHAAAVQQADFATPYTAATPVAEPVLLAQFVLRATTPGHYEMTLAPRSGQKLRAQLAANHVHGFVQLLQAAVRDADWGLSLALPAATMASRAIN